MRREFISSNETKRNTKNLISCLASIDVSANYFVKYCCFLKSNQLKKESYRHLKIKKFYVYFIIKNIFDRK